MEVGTRGWTGLGIEIIFGKYLKKIFISSHGDRQTPNREDCDFGYSQNMDGGGESAGEWAAGRNYIYEITWTGTYSKNLKL